LSGVASQETTMSEREDPWELVKAGRYAEAAEEYSRRYAEDGDLFAFRGRAKALLLAGRADESLQHFREVIEATEAKLRDDGAFIDLGTCHWYLGQPGQAVAAWRESLTAPYTDAAGGAVPPAILLYAATRLGESRLEAEAVRLLRGLLKKHQRRVRRGQAKTARQAHEDFVHPGLRAWPGALVPFLLGTVGEEELDQAAANSPSDVLRSRQQCQADFVAGVRAMREGNQAVFRDRMARCAASPHGALEHEFCLARWEVANGFPAPPFAGGVG
jgi:tetratricopeptide (TPR) repeat protein